MADFFDTFDRVGDIGNGWIQQFKRRQWEGQANSSPWKTDGGQASSGLFYPKVNAIRAVPYPIGGAYDVYYKIAPQRHPAEVFVRYAGGPTDRERLAVEVQPSSGKFVWRTGDFGNVPATGGTEVVIASWTRVGSAESTIRIVMLADYLTIYDTNSPTPEAPVFQGIETRGNQSTGLGFGNGFITEFSLKDLSEGETVPVELSPVRTVAEASLSLEVTTSLFPTLLSSQQRHAAISVGPYLPLEGIPVRRPTVRAPGRATGMVGNQTLDTTGLAPTPLSVDTGMDIRWIPRPGDFSGNTWNPAVNTHPRAYTWLLNRFGGVTQASGELERYQNFTYRSTYGSQVASALDLKGNGFLQLQGPNFNEVSLTLAMVYIPRSTGSSYGLITDDRNSVAAGYRFRDPMRIRYGGNQVYLENRYASMLRAKHPPRAGRPVIVIFSASGNSETFHLLVQGQTRTYGTTNLPRREKVLRTMAWDFFIGALIHTAGEMRKDIGMRGQILELSMDPVFADRAKMLDLNAKLSAIYGVGP